MPSKSPPFGSNVIVYVSICQLTKAIRSSPAEIVPSATNAPTSHDSDETPVVDTQALLFRFQILQAVAIGGAQHPGGGEPISESTFHISNSSESILYVVVKAVPSEVLPIMPN